MENFGSQLHRLIKVCLKSEQSYENAAEHAQSEELRDVFRQSAANRRQIISQLILMINRNTQLVALQFLFKIILTSCLIINIMLNSNLQYPLLNQTICV